MIIGLFAGACVLVAAWLLSGTVRLAFFALGLTLPGLLLQDSWRYSFFALGRGNGTPVRGNKKSARESRNGSHPTRGMNTASALQTAPRA